MESADLLIFLIESKGERICIFKFVMMELSNNDERVLLWEQGLPDADKLTPLSQSLIPPELASAFRILTEPCRSLSDVNSASNTTILNISAAMVESHEAVDLGSDSRKSKVGFVGETNLALAPTLKRPRLAWTPQLHKRFVDVVSHLGLKDAAPKAIVRLMNVEGLTRENVASHLQKYRVYLKRTKISSSVDEELVPMPVTTQQNSWDSDSHGNRYFPASFPMTFMPSPMMPMMYYGHGLNHNRMPMVNMSGVPNRQQD